MMMNAQMTVLRKSISAVVLLCLCAVLVLLPACSREDAQRIAEQQSAGAEMTGNPSATDRAAEATSATTAENTQQPTAQTQPVPEPTPEPTPRPTPTPDWVTIVVAPDGYHEGEFHSTADALAAAGYRLQLVSTQTGTAKGMHGESMEILQTAADVQDIGLGVVVSGGTGITKVWNDEALLALVRRAYDDGKLVAGICAAPAVLGNAGVLQGKQACWYDGPNTNNEMRGAGCENSGAHVTVDGSVVTADGPSAAQAFGEAVVCVLNEMSAR